MPGSRPERATQCGDCRALASGCVWVNGIVKSDPRLPCGGAKQPGFGRERGKEGIREFVNVKSVWVGEPA